MDRTYVFRSHAVNIIKPCNEVFSTSIFVFASKPMATRATKTKVLNKGAPNGRNK